MAIDSTLQGQKRHQIYEEGGDMHQIGALPPLDMSQLDFSQGRTSQAGMGE